MHSLPFSCDRKDHTVILGWNRRVPSILQELDHYLAKGSLVQVIAECPMTQLKIKWKNIKKVESICADTTDREILETLNLAETDSVIILPYSDIYTEKQADARTLNTLLHLRDLGNRNKYSFSIVSEMLDIRNRDLAETDRPDDFVVSESLISMVLTQISENKILAPIYSILLNPGGVEIYLRPAGFYIKTGQAADFYTIIEAASSRGEIAIGYRINSEKILTDQKYGVHLNPVKSHLINLKEEDQIIVISEV